MLYTVKCPLLAMLGGRVVNNPLQLADVLLSFLRELEVIDKGWWLVEEAVAVVVTLLVKKKVMLPGLERIAVYPGRTTSQEMQEMLEGVC